jgi:hypothetical protein
VRSVQAFRVARSEDRDAALAEPTKAEATIGLCVTTVALISGASALVTASAVVPPSRITVEPGRTSPAARVATDSLLVTLIVVRAA